MKKFGQIEKMMIFEKKHPNLLKALEIKEKAAVLPTAVCIGDA